MEEKIYSFQEMLNDLEGEVSSMIQEIEATDTITTSRLQVLSIFYNPLSSLCIFLSAFRKSLAKLSSFRQSGSLEMEMISV